MSLWATHILAFSINIDVGKLVATTVVASHVIELEASDIRSLIGARAATLSHHPRPEPQQVDH